MTYLDRLAAWDALRAVIAGPPGWRGATEAKAELATRIEGHLE